MNNQSQLKVIIFKRVISFKGEKVNHEKWVLLMYVCIGFKED